ncbi:MAG: hypothetical protein V4640_14395 [Verrucomicrobiota bacterium]
MSLSPSQLNDGFPPSIHTPEVVETAPRKLTYKDGAATPETATTAVEVLAFTSGLNVYNNGFQSASAFARHKGLQSIRGADNRGVISPQIMNSESFFMTAKVPCHS